MHEPTAPLRERPAHAVRAAWAAWAPAFVTRLKATGKPQPFLLAAVAGLFMAYLGPFDSDKADLIRRYLYWPGVIISGTVLGLVVSAAVDAAVDREQRRPILSAVLTAAAMTPPGALLVLAATRVAFEGEALSYPALLGPVFLLSLAMTGLNYLADRRSGAPTLREAQPAPIAVRFLDRLPPRLRGGDLYAVEAEDHYLRLHTSRGSDLILMRLADAIVELDGLSGAQTHRSWWVARAAVVDARRADGRATLVLPSGAEAPVSRSFSAKLRAEGWF